MVTEVEELFDLIEQTEILIEPRSKKKNGCFYSNHHDSYHDFLKNDQDKQFCEYYSKANKTVEPETLIRERKKKNIEKLVTELNQSLKKCTSSIRNSQEVSE